jgi:hypothetical protein
VTQPANGASVPIPTTAPLAVIYAPTTIANTTILAIAVDSRAKWFFTLPASETGTLSIPASQFKDFQPGPGTLALVRITTNRPGGSPFADLSVEYQNITQLQVTWQ